MKILLLGTDNFSASSLYFMLRHGYEMCAVITHSKAQHITRLQNIAKQNNIPFYIIDNINSDDSYNLIKEINPDIIFSIHFDRILHKRIIDLALKCAINLHPSLLPKYRGMSPFQSVLKNNESQTGITIHYMAENVDEGDIIEQMVIPLEKNIYLSDLYIIMMQSYPVIIEKALKKIISGKFNTIKQDGSKATYYGKIKDEDYIISQEDTCINTYNKIRAFSKPDKGARYNNIIIWHADILKLGENCFNIIEKEEGLYIYLHDGVLFSKKGNYTTISNNDVVDTSLGGGVFFN